MTENRMSLKERFLRGKFKFFAKWSLVLIAAGAVIAFGGFAAGGFNTDMFYNNPIDQTAPVYEPLPSDIRRIEIDVDDGFITLAPADSDGSMIQYDKNAMSAEVNNGVYRMENIEQDYSDIFNQKWYRVINNTNIAYLPSQHVILSLPENFSGEIVIRCNYSTVDIYDLTGDYNLRLEALNSNNVSLSELSTTKDISVSLEYGTLDMNNIHSDEAITIKSGDSNINASEIECTDLNVDVTYGACDLRYVEGETCTVTAQNANLSLGLVEMAQSINTTGDYGSIEVREIFAPNILLFSENGNVNGTIAADKSDFMVISVSSLDDFNAGQYSGGENILVYGSEYGSAEIEFTGRFF